MDKPIEMVKRGNTYVAASGERQPAPKPKRKIKVVNNPEANMLSSVLVGMVDDFFKLIRKEMFK